MSVEHLAEITCHMPTSMHTGSSRQSDFCVPLKNDCDAGPGTLSRGERPSRRLAIRQSIQSVPTREVVRMRSRRTAMFGV